MLTKKQQAFWNLILSSIKELKAIPTIGYLKNKSNYKSYNTIYKYLEQLEKKGYLKVSKKKRKIIEVKSNVVTNLFQTVPILNSQKSLVIWPFYLKNKDCLGYRVSNNNLRSFGIFRNDILIIDKASLNLSNCFVVLLENKTYNTYKCYKRNDFLQLINDKKTVTLIDKSKLIGKVI